MVIRQKVDRKNNFYSVELSTEATSIENDFISAYGEPKVDVGGTIAVGEGSFTRSTQLVMIRSQFPVSFGLDALTDADAVAKVNAWASTVRSRIQAVLNTLAGKSTPNFPSTTTYNLVGTA